ncbi:surface protease GP63, partial [Trypanosoma rangeli]
MAPRVRRRAAVLRELPCKGQGAMQAYTVAAKEEGNSGWAPIRIFVSTEDLKKDGQWKWRKKRYCENAGEQCTNYLGYEATCTATDVLSEEKKALYEKTIIPMAVKLHAERLLVKPVVDKIIVPNVAGGPCQHFKIPITHKT